MFGRKTKALQQQTAAQQAQLDQYSRELQTSAVERDRLIKTIRDMDQLIFLMSQGTSWEQQRSHFNELQIGTEARMQAESARIRDVLIPEIRKVYTEPTSANLIEHK